MSSTAIEMAIRDMETDKKTLEELVKLVEKDFSKLKWSRENAYERGFKTGLIQAYTFALKNIDQNIINVTKQYESEQEDDE